MPVTNLIMKSAYLTKKQIEYLEKHPEVNFSGLARKALQKYIEAQK